MSTRCTVHFHYGENERPEAIVYRHSDGYPAAMEPDLEQFFADVQKQTDDTRFSDPTYLAAKFVVWQADHHRQVLARFRGDPVPALDFLGVGVVLDDPGDIEYRWHVHCGGGVPQVTYEALR